MGKESIAPWHMWGNNVTTKVVATGLSTTTVTTIAQLTRVNYKRPDTWRFFLYARIIDGATTGAGPQVLNVDFSLILGVGRGLSKIGFPALEGSNVATTGPFPAFKRFAWKWTTGNTFPIGSQKFSNNTVGPVDDETLAAPPVNMINTFVAQDFSCQASIIFQDTNLNDTATVEIGAYFSPQTHHRPEWHKGLFAGGEDEGGAQ